MTGSSSPPPIPFVPSQQARVKIARTVRFAHLSAGTMLALGGISAVISARHPLSAAFFISVAIVVNGAIEWRFARRLAAFDARAPEWMAVNQLAVGAEIATYSAWQAAHLTPQMIDAVLRRPFVATVLESLPSEQLAVLNDSLLPMLRSLYVIVGAVAVIGCAATAAYFWARRKQVAPA